MTSTTISPASAANLRLTRRGRTLLLLALVAVMFGAFSFGQSSSQASGTRVAGSPAAPAPVVAETVVLPGESLWTVARRIAPENDPRDVVEQIRQLNDMRGSQLLIGQQLLLPVAA